jgi:N-acetyl-gamma-glutamyl-phosphate reductase
MVRVKIIGAGGFGGVGMIELLQRHPTAKAAWLVDVENVGQPISATQPHLRGICDMTILSPDQAPTEGVDVVVSATPDRIGMTHAAAHVKAGAKVIDYSGDFRFRTEAIYADYARTIGLEPKHLAPELLPQSAYGLTELHRDEIKKAKVVGNPGCFAMSIILGIGPAVKAGIIDVSRVIADSKTGASGAGKKPSPTLHFPARYENMNAYKVLKHQHRFEVETELSRLAGKPVQVVLTTQLVPLSRGIMSTLYGQLDAGMDAKKVYDIYQAAYGKEKFIRLMPLGEASSNAAVRGSNFCDVSVHVEDRTGTLLVVSHIDNLMKGQAGSALQNLNVACGLEETAGLMFPGQFP